VPALDRRARRAPRRTGAHPGAIANLRWATQEGINMNKKSLFPQFASKPPVQPAPARPPMTPLAPEQLRHVAGGPVVGPTC
jgi:hypothetical protein